MMWWDNFLHEMGDPSWFSKGLLAAVGALFAWIWHQSKKIKSVYTWADSQIPKTDKEKEEIKNREKFISDLMKKELIEKRDYDELKVEIDRDFQLRDERFSFINTKLEEFKDDIKKDLSEVKELIGKIIYK